MEKDKRNQLIVVGIILMLFIVIILFVTYSIINGRKNKKMESNVKIQQIYSSDYNIKMLNDKFFIGSYENNKINVLIDSNGVEIYKDSLDMFYDNVYMMEDGNTLFYNIFDNKVNMYIFDGESLKFYYTLNDVLNAKPIIYVKNSQRYIIGFASVVDNDLHLFNVITKSDIVLEDVTIVGDAISNDSYDVFNNKYIVVKDDSGMMGVIDIDGNLIIDYEYKNIVGTYNNSFIVLSKKDKYGIIDNKNNFILKARYKVISGYKDYYLVVDDKNKMALFDTNINDLTGFKMKYDDLIEYDLRSKNNSISLKELHDKIIVLNNYQELKNGTEYDKHNMYVIENGKIVADILQKELVIDKIVYMIDQDNNLKIFDEYLVEIMNLKLEDNTKIESVRCVFNDIFEISFGDSEITKKEYYNSNGEKVDFSLGDLQVRNEHLSIFINKDGDRTSVFIYDSNNNLIEKKEGENILINDNFIVVDNNIYKIIVS